MSYLKLATVEEKEMCVLRFLKQSPISQCNVVTELNMEKIHIQTTLSDVGYSSFKRLVVFCTEKEGEDRALPRKLLIESRKRFLEDHKNQLDELICS
jgi:hypothetical protein